MANGYDSSLHTEVHKKSYFLLQKPLKTCINLKYQSKGSTYILNLLAFVEIRLFHEFLWERKAGFGKLRKTCGMQDLSRKRGGNAGSGAPFPDPVKATRSSTEVPQKLQTTWFAHGNLLPLQLHPQVVRLSNRFG